jgi:hypothetical protein
MRTRLFFVLVAVSLTLPVVFAQGSVKRPGAAYMLSFDPATLQTVEGTVVRIHQVPHPNVWLTGVQLGLRTHDGEISVHLGPSWFIDNQELHLEVEDHVSVTGSHVRPNGVETIVATDVRRGDELLHLRAPDGMPVWVAWHWRAP